MTTSGGASARTVPSSGMVIWKSESTSSRKASNGSSVRSSLVDEQHRRAGQVGLERLEERAGAQEALGEEVLLDALAVDAAWLASAMRISSICRG